MVVVIGDEGIHNKVGKDVWNDVVSIIVSGIKTKKVEQGIIDGVESCRGLLKKHFPISTGDTNELSNKVVYE
jgi:putative membrane protein